MNSPSLSALISGTTSFQFVEPCLLISQWCELIHSMHRLIRLEKAGRRALRRNTCVEDLGSIHAIRKIEVRPSSDG